MGTRCADHVTPLYPQKLALTSPTGGGRSVGIVRVQTKATEFSLVLVCLVQQAISQTMNIVGVAASSAFTYIRLYMYVMLCYAYSMQHSPS